VQYLTGFHAIQEMLLAGLKDGRLLVAQGDGKAGPRLREILETARQRGISVSTVDAKTLDALAVGHRGIALELTKERTDRVSAHLEDFLAEPREKGLVLVLDHIEDPQNLGAILRSADAFAVDLVVAPIKRASPLTEAAVRASSGAASWVPLAFVGNLGDALRKLKKAGFWAYSADMGGKSAGETELPGKCVIVMGNEGAGVSHLIGSLCDERISIPMGGHVDSLNVSAAASVLLYEYRRQQPF